MAHMNTRGPAPAQDSRIRTPWEEEQEGEQDVSFDVEARGGTRKSGGLGSGVAPLVGTSSDASGVVVKGGRGKWRRTVGLLMLAVVVVLWTASNFMTSAILADNSYSKPYFVTYINTSFFVLPLIPILALKAWRRPEELRQWRDEMNAWRAQGWKYKVLGRTKTHDERPSDESDRSDHESRELLLSNPLDSDDPNKPAPRHHGTQPAPIPQLSVAETFHLSLHFSLLWFLANYSLAACLEYTTVASSTILSSTSSVFTLLFGALAGVEIFTWRKLLAVLASLAGIVLISSVDLSGENTDDEHRGDFPEKSAREIAVGDALALLSAVVYGIYSVVMKKRIADESRVNMPLFFGFVGLVNILLLWPGMLLLHFTGVETFAMPPGRREATIILTNGAASLVADIAWAYAVLLTSPIVVTVGLSLTIPLSLVGESVLNGQKRGWLYWIGAVVVVASFVFVNHEEKKDEEGDGRGMGPDPLDREQISGRDGSGR